MLKLRNQLSLKKLKNNILFNKTKEESGRVSDSSFFYGIYRCPHKSKGESPQYIIYDYDTYDRVTITRPDGAKLTNDYSGNVMTTTNYDGQKKTVTYLPAGKPLKIKDNETIEIVYEYYGDGNVKSTVINGTESSRINYTYDANGFPATMNDPSLGTRSYSYNAFGELVSETNSDSLTTDYTYDLLGRMTRRSDNDGISSWHYDQQKKGLLDYSHYEANNTNAPAVTENYVYDRLGRTIEHIQPLGAEYQELSFKYDYNEWGLQKSVTYPDGFKVSYNYDYNGFTTEVENGLTNTSIWKADSSDRYGNISHFILGNDISVNNNYNNITGLLENQSAIIGQESILQHRIQNMIYQWDVYGNLIRRNNLNIMKNESFRYDAYNRLTDISVNGTDVCSIIFDDKGNITFKEDAGNMSYGSDNPYSIVKISEMPDLILFNENQNVTYTSFDKVSSIVQGTKRLDVYYGAKRQRVYHDMKHNDLTRNTTKRFFTNLYEEVRRDEDIKKYHYLTSPSGLFAIFVIDNDTSAMSYVLKDHIGSLYATVTNGEVVLVGRMLSPDIVIQDPEYS